MGLGTITLLGMLCTPGQVPADVTTWNSPSMKIPIDYHPSKRGEIKELLCTSPPTRARRGNQAAVAVPDKDTHFTFNAPADGVYWFNMVVVDKSGRREPADVFKAAPALKVMFDTKKPVVTIASAQRVGDDVTVVWKVTEKNPDWSKFKLEYSPNSGDVGPGPDAARGGRVDPVQGGRRPATVTVRVAVTDMAGHTAEATSPVAGTTVAAKPTADRSSPSAARATSSSRHRRRSPAWPAAGHAADARGRAGQGHSAARPSRGGRTPAAPPIRPASRRPRARRRAAARRDSFVSPPPRRPGRPEAEAASASAHRRRPPTCRPRR